MSVLSLLELDSPSEFADWYRIGAEYVYTVSTGMGFDTGTFAADAREATDAMRAGDTDLRPELARSVAADLLADAVFSDPFCEWMPLWYELALAPFVQFADYRLRAVAREYATGLDYLSVPRFSRPRDVYVGGRSPLSTVDGFVNRFVLADALIHLEWYVYVARESGIDVPASLVERTREETVAYYTGQRETLSADVRRFQELLFADDAWVRDIGDAYGLNSALFGVWERILRTERERLAATA
ncbi:hypothetical protein SAMN04487948_12158 [Halogranum amylolyticum]|uniref:DUF8116 domain-containing protein n=1 Tax=Halogranum amylolyticum TaxID=660520 RepID=A0A1H8W0T7_9EURY|nr:hypothetical protein [Halogranum amylolyticum]SEP20778.1 hypothetical protein SAMN04487948_12158 [Halogranum amylolyticum]